MEKGHYSVLRVSHLSQIDNFSIEQQKESIETYATFHSIEITEHLAECGSGTTDERKQIQILYRLIEEDKVAVPSPPGNLNENYRNKGYSHTDRPDSAVDSVQSDVDSATKLNLQSKKRIIINYLLSWLEELEWILGSFRDGVKTNNYNAKYHQR